MPSWMKPYNLTYFIMFIAVATCRDPFFEPSHRKPYKRFYIGCFITKTVKKLKPKEFRSAKLILDTDSIIQNIQATSVFCFTKTTFKL